MSQGKDEEPPSTAQPEVAGIKCTHYFSCLSHMTTSGFKRCWEVYLAGWSCAWLKFRWSINKGGRAYVAVTITIKLNSQWSWYKFTLVDVCLNIYWFWFYRFLLLSGFCKKKKGGGSLKLFSRPLKILSVPGAEPVGPSGYKVSEDDESTNRKREPRGGVISLSSSPPPRQEGSPSKGVCPDSICSLWG